jgi:hypothetical protein
VFRKFAAVSRDLLPKINTGKQHLKMNALSGTILSFQIFQTSKYLKKAIYFLSKGFIKVNKNK